MRIRIIPGMAAAVALFATCAWGQETEAGAGFGIRGTFSALTAASTDFASNLGSAAGDGGFRLMLYPTWKLSTHWMFYGAYQVVSRPYYYSDFGTPGRSVRGSVAQGYLSYSLVGQKASLIARVGELSSAFGAFSLHYDDRDNPMVDIPMQYGYYGAMATLTALAGGEVDGTWNKWDARAQYVNSSPADPRSIFSSGQYGNWAGGAGYTILQGLRVGVSGYRGPYLYRGSQYYLPIEGSPRNMPGTGVGLEAQWGRGHWNIRGELQKFALTYGPVPTFHERTGYGEAQRVLNARWYVASRFGYLNADYIGQVKSIEVAAGFRPGAGQLIKLSYETVVHDNAQYPNRTLALQFVTAIHPLAFARH